MADKLIGNLITGKHVAPRAGMPFKQKLTIGIAITVVVSLGSFLVWKFINYREESRVTHFFDELVQGRYDQAYAIWDGDDRYQMKDFMADFGQEGYYTKGMHEARVVTSKSKGGAVVVCVELDTFQRQLPILVDKESLKLSYSPPSLRAQCN
jgi:hypothetical protein